LTYLGFLIEGKTLLLYSSHLPLGVPNGLVINHASLLMKFLEKINTLTCIKVGFLPQWQRQKVYGSNRFEIINKLKREKIVVECTALLYANST
jgi:hypothetical protein